MVNSGAHPEHQRQSITRPRQQESDVSDRVADFLKRNTQCGTIGT